MVPDGNQGIENGHSGSPPEGITIARYGSVICINNQDKSDFRSVRCVRLSAGCINYELQPKSFDDV